MQLIFNNLRHCFDRRFNPPKKDDHRTVQPHRQGHTSDTLAAVDTADHAWAFDEFEGTAHIDTVHPADSRVTITIASASVTTGNEQRDGRIKTPDFLDVANFPTINGVIKAVTVDFEETGSAKDPFGNTRIGFEGETTISRTDWNLSFQAALETGGVLVSEKVKLEFDISAIAQVPSQA